VNIRPVDFIHPFYTTDHLIRDIMRHVERHIPGDIDMQVDDKARTRIFGHGVVNALHAGYRELESIVTPKDLTRLKRELGVKYADLVYNGLWFSPVRQAIDAFVATMQPQVTGRAREDGRIADAEDVRLWNLISCAGGATGILYPRWRPLLDGPLFGAFGAFGMDGSVTPRAEMAGRVAQWANAHPEIWKSRPVRGWTWGCCRA